MGYLEDIDKAYQNAKNAADSWQGVNAQAQHDAHKVMQSLVAQRDAYLASMSSAPTVSTASMSSAPTVSTSTASATSAPAPSSTPASPYWITGTTSTEPRGVLQADPDIIINPEIDTSGDYIVERFFEELGGTELINLSRHDLIDGIRVVYNPIANLSSLRRRYNPNNIIAIDFLSEDEFSRASIDLLSRGMYEPYFNDNGDLVIEVDIIKSEENIEAEISQSGTVSRIEL